MLQPNSAANTASRPTQYQMYQQPTRSRSKSVEPARSNSKKFRFGTNSKKAENYQQFRFQQTDVDYAM